MKTDAELLEAALRVFDKIAPTLMSPGLQRIMARHFVASLPAWHLRYIVDTLREELK